MRFAIPRPADAKRIGWSLPLALSLLFVQAWAQDQVTPTEKPFLWAIEGETPSYLYGTIHVPDDRVLAIPEVVGKAIASSDAFYAELAMDDLASMAGAFMLPAGQSLKGILDEKLYQRLDKYFQSKGVPLAVMQNFKVWAVNLQLGLLDYLPALAAGKQPLDLFLYQRAKSQGKQVGGLETVEEQLSLFEGLSQDEQIKLLEDSLTLLEESVGKPSPSDTVVKIYLKGDTSELLEELNRWVDLDDPVGRRFTQKVLGDRNVTMANRIAEKIGSNAGKSFFFAIGSGHLGADDGVIKLLEEKGFRLTRLSSQDIRRFVQ